MTRHIYTIRYNKFSDEYLQDIPQAFTTYEAAEAKALEILDTLIKTAEQEMEYVKSNPDIYNINSSDIIPKVENVYAIFKQYNIFSLTACHCINKIVFHNYARFIDYTKNIYKLRPIGHDNTYPHGYWSTTIYIKHYTVDL